MQLNVTDALSALRAETDAFLAAPVLQQQPDAAGAIRRALQMRAAADAVVSAVVVDARASGMTWQAIGEALGVTRQAAFQRYGRPTDPTTGQPVDAPPIPDAAELASAVVDDLASGRWARITERFDPTMRDGLSEDALAAAWAQIQALSGALEGVGETDVVRAADVTITTTPLAMEAGDYAARIAFRDDRTIAGLHLIEAKETT
ncbi:DUF3887 domain-containing protein [Microbacterium sp. ABRD28]|uniref:DUF3887 domain-containing protein n=1 Tax=Microbacterium sp. ABRD28 TaxID=2268461 RepID=UPI000F555BCB|nr:DUF3887 domain-containing protein [Microbacterium sp. ABRD28]AZC12395.1 DUF3887 domain-containing protein [Microbacterium sp. ABRD28]